MSRFESDSKDRRDNRDRDNRDRDSRDRRDRDNRDRRDKKEFRPSSNEAEEAERLEDGRFVEGRNAITEALRAGKTIDKLYVQDGLRDGAISTIVAKAKKQGTFINFLPKIKLDQMAGNNKHQGVIAAISAYEYSEMDAIFKHAEEKGHDPFVFILDEIEDPHNLGAIIRTANICGADGVIIPKHRATGITATVVKASAGAINYTPVVKVTNIGRTIEELKEKGMWFACADMDGDTMYNANLTGPIGLVIGNEGEGVTRLVKEKCDFVVSVPMEGEINSLNASVAAGVLAYEVVRQRRMSKK